LKPNPKNWDADNFPNHPIPVFDEESPPVPTYEPSQGESLRDKFHDAGIQVFVKMVSINLTPETPETQNPRWTVEGLMNEHIVATAVYVLDSDNIAEDSATDIKFRALTDPNHPALRLLQYHDLGWTQSLYGSQLRRDDPLLQSYGAVMVRQGRLIAWPNTLQTLTAPTRLADRTRKGHRRLLVVSLVDPTTRIISTANVPPQQAD